MRDYLFARSRDEILISDLPPLDTVDFTQKHRGNSTFAERHFRKIQLLSWITFVIEAIFPVMLGLAVVAVAYQDMLAFLQTITK